MDLTASVGAGAYPTQLCSLCMVTLHVRHKRRVDRCILVVPAAWLDDNSEAALQKDLEILESLKRQTAEDFTWMLQNWHNNLNLKGWATVLGISTSHSCLLMYRNGCPDAPSHALSEKARW